MRAKDVLLKSLQDYTGTVVFVSHDRYFIDKLATRIFEVEDGAVHLFPGNYEDYLWWKEGRQDAVAEIRPEEPAAKAATPSENGQPARGERRLNPIKLKQMRDRQDEIEEEVARLETEIAGYESALQNFVSIEETMRTNELLGSRRTDLESLLQEWETVSQSIEANS
jgi:ATP-binding cassette subfamily F protein 3